MTSDHRLLFLRVHQQLEAASLKVFLWILRSLRSSFSPLSSIPLGTRYGAEQTGVLLGTWAGNSGSRMDSFHQEDWGKECPWEKGWLYFSQQVEGDLSKILR